MTNTQSRAALPWVCFAVSCFVALIFAVLYYAKTQNANAKEYFSITNFVDRPTTNQITNEVIKEVEKKVEVPAQIPNDYIIAKSLYDKMLNAQIVGHDKILFGMKDVKVRYLIQDSNNPYMNEDAIKAKFELCLRRNGVPVNPDSTNQVVVVLNGRASDSTLIVPVEIQTSLDELQWVSRNGQWCLSRVAVWNSNPNFGSVGKDVASQKILDAVEQQAELFANDFLSANPKQ